MGDFIININTKEKKKPRYYPDAPHVPDVPESTLWSTLLSDSLDEKEEPNKVEREYSNFSI